MKKITATALLWGLGGLALLFFSILLELYFTPTQSPAAALPPTNLLGTLVFHSVIKLLELTGIACFVLGIIHILVETESWSEYFRERLREIVIQQAYLNTLDKERLAVLQTSVLKAQFKDTQVDREGSFLSYLNTNLHPYIANPYREDVAAELIYTDAGDCWSVFDRVTYVCRKSASGIQQNVEGGVDPEEYVSIENFRVEIQFPSTHSQRGTKETIYDDTPKLGTPFDVSLDKYKDVDGLIIIITEKYKIRKNQFQYWTMAGPTKNFTITFAYPGGYKVQCKPMVLSPDQVICTEVTGYYSAKYDFWMLPESGLAWIINPEVSPSLIKPSAPKQ
jgi:hypothetical protein